MPVNVSRLYQVLLAEMGSPDWWPADSKVEILVGAILVQNTAWSNVEKSIVNLKAATQFDPQLILALSDQDLQSLIRPSGFFVNKAAAIKAALRWFDDHDWDYQAIVNSYGQNLRAQLLSIRGIGYETADVLLVYLFDQVVFVADAYARRLFAWLNGKHYKNYQDLYRQVRLPDHFTSQDAQDFHALIDFFGKAYLAKDGSVRPNFLQNHMESLVIFEQDTDLV